MALHAITHRKKHTWWQQFQEAPCPALARFLYSQRQRIVSAQPPSRFVESSITAVCISDTHNSQPALPSGDLLIHAGDLTQGGTADELQGQLDWLNRQPHSVKVVIAGNHDIVLDHDKSTEFGVVPHGAQSLRWGSIIYLQHAGTTLSLPNGRTLKVFGHPSTRKHGNWAFQHDHNVDCFTGQIDGDVDILVTHSPARFHLDVAGWGDEFLMRELWRVKPSLHVFGHVHEGFGCDTLVFDHFESLYERVCARSAGILALVQMAFLLLRALIAGSSRNVRSTILINASAVGGLHDQQRHNAQVIQV